MFYIKKALFAKDTLLSLGQNLLCSRQELNQTIAAVAQKTHLSPKVIEKIEKGQYGTRVDIEPILTLIAYYKDKIVLDIDEFAQSDD